MDTSIARDNPTYIMEDMSLISLNNDFFYKAIDAKNMKTIDYLSSVKLLNISLWSDKIYEYALRKGDLDIVRILDKNRIPRCRNSIGIAIQSDRVDIVKKELIELLVREENNYLTWLYDYIIDKLIK